MAGNAAASSSRGGASPASWARKRAASGCAASHGRPGIGASRLAQSFQGKWVAKRPEQGRGKTGGRGLDQRPGGTVRLVLARAGT